MSAGPGVDLVILFGAAFFMMFNYMVLLNNRWLTRLNTNLAHISGHNMNRISVIVLVNVIIICSFMLFTAV
jgi:ABC-type Fe3+-siderophore transport system permease subunit